MIVVCAIPSELSLALVTDALESRGLPYVMLNQRRFADTDVDIQLAGIEVQAKLTVDRWTVDLHDVSGIYTRMMDWRAVPEMHDASEHSMRRCAQWHDAISNWFEIAPGCVMNRATAAASNASKPHQSQLIRQFGFSVPETLVTNDPERVREFHARHTRVVFKSISGMRSIVKFLDDDSTSRLPLIRSCPVQFQRYIPGVNIRVHTVAGELFASRIDTNAVDYRYATDDGGYADLKPWTLPDDIAARCLALAAGLGLELAGIDLIFTDDGEVFCLEVNPGPAFSYFELNTGQEIAGAIVRALAEGRSVTPWPPHAPAPASPHQSTGQNARPASSLGP